MDIKVSDYIKHIDFSNISFYEFYEITKDDKFGEFLYIIKEGETTFPYFYIKSKHSTMPLSVYLTIDSSEESIKNYIEREIINKKYRQFEFSIVLIKIKLGQKVTRSKWENKNVFLYYVPHGRYDAKTDAAKSFAAEDGKVDYGDYIAIRTEDGYVIPYTPTQDDLLADDWELVDDNE